jgi:hypothetical protein
MFAYMSLLVETCAFDVITVNFMIVGHTHSSIDQYFSTLSTAIKNCDFIGSPMALWQLFEGAHSDEYEHKRPKVNRRIAVYYDFKTAIEPYLNTDIMYYQTPFCFMFFLVLGKAVMQYRLFSSHQVWLPIAPTVVAETMDAFSEECLTSIRFPERLSIVGGKTVLLADLGVSEISAERSIGDGPLLARLNVVNTVYDELLTIELCAMDNLQARMANEALELNETELQAALVPRFVTRKKVLQDVQKALDQHSTKEVGYIMWLNLVKAAQLPPLEDLAPLPFSPACLLETLTKAPQVVVPVVEEGESAPHLPPADNSGDDDSDGEECASSDMMHVEGNNVPSSPMPPAKNKVKVQLSARDQMILTRANDISRASKTMLGHVSSKRVTLTTSSAGDLAM